MSKTYTIYVTKKETTGEEVDRSFRQFLSEKPVNMPSIKAEMAMGVGESKMDMPVSFQPLANLLAVIQHPGMRARALDWIMFDGLHEALLGRKKLWKLVNDEIAKRSSGQGTGTIPLPGRQAPGQAAQGMAAMMSAEATDPLAWHGSDPFSGDPMWALVDEQDLFSPEAWRRRPVLQQLTLKTQEGEWVNILEYYDRYFEPRVMIIDREPGMKARIDLVALRDLMQKKGLEPFRYGGFDGYIQFVEKGDWREPGERYTQHGGDNQQYGPDLRLEDQGTDRYGRPLTPLRADPATGTPVLHLAGGPVYKDERRAAKKIDEMGAQFGNLFGSLEANLDVSAYPPHVVQAANKLLAIKDQLDTMDVAAGEKGAYKHSALHVATGEQLNRAKSEIDLSVRPKLQSILPMVLRMFREGLSLPMVKNADEFDNPEAFGPQIDPDAMPPKAGGWYKILDDGKIEFRLPEAVQQKVYDIFTAGLKKNPPMLRTKDRFSRFMPTLFRPDREGRSNALLYLNVVAEQSIGEALAKGDPEVRQAFMRTVHESPHPANQVHDGRPHDRRASSNRRRRKCAK